MNLTDYGLSKNDFFTEANKTYARIIAVHKERYQLVTEQGECFGKLKASIYYNNCSEEYPTTGDFVEIQYNSAGDSLILKTLSRKSKFSRNDFSGHAAGYVKTIKEQTVAANFDYVFIMQSLNHDFNVKRLDRYLTQSWQSGAIPVVILTKADLIEDTAEYAGMVRKAAIGVDVCVVSSKTGEGMSELAKYLKNGITIVFLGSSGVGKSSLVNALALKEVMSVNEIREDDSKGRHTTTHRQLIRLDSGVMIIDTPGMRELGMWNSTEGLRESFADVEQFFGKCRFSDCRHQSEPGCAIKQAIADGKLSNERWQSYLTLVKETEFVEDRSAYQRSKNQRNVAIKLAERQMKNIQNKK